jgi:2-amino-4-hydroxy-6-hydroxymethyldihydropteridine diphosphokinase
MTSSRVTAYIAVGSNIDPERNIQEAFKALKTEVEVAASSTFYRTEPIGGKRMDAFVNGVWEIRTCRSPLDLKHRILEKIERQLGRRCSEDRYAARTMDLDLILYGEQVIHQPALIIPHPDLARDFVWIPLLELQPRLLRELNNPILVDRIRELTQPYDSAGSIVPGEPLEKFSAELKALLSSG